MKQSDPTRHIRRRFFKLSLSKYKIKSLSSVQRFLLTIPRRSSQRIATMTNFYLPIRFWKSHVSGSRTVESRLSALCCDLNIRAYIRRDREKGMEKEREKEGAPCRPGHTVCPATHTCVCSWRSIVKDHLVRYPERRASSRGFDRATNHSPDPNNILGSPLEKGDGEF